MNDHPVELLSNIDLINLCNELNLPLIHCGFKDNFDDMKRRDGCYIINIGDNHTIGGTHWTALYIKNKYAIYFDSYGENMPMSIRHFVERGNRMSIRENMSCIQALKDTSCGWYCLAFLAYMHHSKDANMTNLNMFIRMFKIDPDRLHMNRKILAKYINSLF